MPPLYILLLFGLQLCSSWLEESHREHSVLGTAVCCVHNLSFNTAPCRMGDVSWIKPAHWLFITRAFSLVIPAVQWTNGVIKEWIVSTSFLCLSRALSLDRNLMFWSVAWTLLSVCLFRLVIKCLKGVVVEKCLHYPKKILVSGYLGKFVKFFIPFCSLKSVVTLLCAASFQLYVPHGTKYL